MRQTDLQWARQMNRGPKRRGRARPGIVAVLSLMWLTTSAAAQLRVVDYNIAQLQGNWAALEDVFAAMHDDDKPGFAVPVAVFTFQEVRTADVAPLLNMLNSSAPPGVTYAAGTYTNEDKDGFAGAQAMFYRTDIVMEMPSGHDDIYSGAGRFTDRWLVQLIGYASPNARFYIYSSHLKSDTGTANQQERLMGVTNIRANADALGSSAHIIYSGDMNFYNNGEPGYLHFLSAGNGQGFDPLGSGSWAGSANAIKHSQSPRVMAGGGLIGGGLDDRFDFQLSTASFGDGEGLSRMFATYRALANDGLHYNLDIHVPANMYYPDDLPRSDALADDLYIASDHLPIIVDYQIPAVMAASIGADYGRVIQNALFSVAIEVTNAANVVLADGGDELAFTAQASLGLSGTYEDTVQALVGISRPSFTLNTSQTGAVDGRVTLTSASEGVANPLMFLDTTGTIVRPSNPSFSDALDMNELELSNSYTANSGMQFVTVGIHNFGFDSLQALLDVDSIKGFLPPFTYVGPPPPIGIGDAHATLTFAIDTAGLETGNYESQIVIPTSDEDIPGETASSLQLTWSVLIDKAQVCNADITGDSIVDVSDLLAIVAAWGVCPGGGACPADINDDGLVNVIDLLAVVGAWGACP